MPHSPNGNFNHFLCYDGWSSQQGSGATIDNYHDALHQHADEIKFKRQYPEDAFAVFRYLAHAGHAAGMCSYGVSIMFSQGTALDRTSGFEWVEKSVTLGFAKAQRHLATCLSKGIGCEQNGVEALRWAQAAIDQGFMDAHSTVGTMYFEGYGVPVNHAKGIEHYFLGMDAGSIECISQVGLLYQDGTGVKKDIKKAVELYEKALSLGCGFGLYYLGTLYQDGDDGIPQDPSKAATYFGQAVQLEHDPSPAMRSLAYLYENGIGVEQSYEMSLRYYLEAAKFDDRWALFYLGHKYAFGTGVEQDNTKAIEFYERAAKQKYAPAITSLGYSLSEGQGCPQDYVRSAELYQQSAALGDGVGAYNCGIVFRTGKGVPINLFKALDYNRMAVRLKYDGAKSCLGPNSSISHALYKAAHALQRENKDKEALDHFYAAAVQGHLGAVYIVTGMYRNAAGLGPVSYEKEIRYFEPPEAPESTLSATPNELLIQIFQWLHPKECILLRRISRRIWTLFEDDFVPRHLFTFHFQLLPSREMRDQHWFDQMLFYGPRSFQTAYLEMTVNGLQILRPQHRKYASLRDNTLNIFPAAFCKWTSLTSIQLSNSGLVGTIPDSIKYLISLKELVLSRNRCA
ncbi:hypothetical protein HDU81_005710 [Chytriomyces hyalinus]|nr:hypothetical protein HDU81_005710 [Chytriomyces hyalinus]